MPKITERILRLLACFRKVACARCGGTGEEIDHSKCKLCGGSGEIELDD